jgi:ABC-2 type transport system ATP-binding protein
VAHRPELLLLDEPAGGLDPAVRREFLETAIQLLNEAGTTILFSSHYMTDVERLAGRIVMIHDGKVLLDNDLDDLREEFSLALVPLTSGAGPDRLITLDGCLAVRKRSDALHAILRHQPAKASALLESKLGIKGARCEAIPLEEMFIELVRGNH